MNPGFQPPAREIIARQVRTALEEDLGTGDLTAQLIPTETLAEASLITREEAVICGRPWFDEVFAQLDSGVVVAWELAEGDRVTPGQVLCRLSGRARAILSGERTALNYLQTLSGTASLARRYAEAVAGTGARVLDTRKTLPGLRLPQKYAVRCGGGHNHRIGLFDAILIKENHIAAAGSITAALEAARSAAPGVDIEVEVENLEELREALAGGAKHILLDNFTLDGLREAVGLSAGAARLEASGGVNLSNIREIALTGVNDISVGGLTKDVRAIDLSMRFRLGLS